MPGFEGSGGRFIPWTAAALLGTDKALNVIGLGNIFFPPPIYRLLLWEIARNFIFLLF